MKKTTHTTNCNLTHFQSILENFAYQSLDALAGDEKLKLDELALSLASSLVAIINANSSHFKPFFAKYSACEIFEIIRKLVIRLIAEQGHRYGHPFEAIESADIVDAYERLLAQRLSKNERSCSIVACENEKRRRGVFYTPDALARELTTMALRPLVLNDSASNPDECEISVTAGSLVSVEKLLSLKIVDPAMGAGTFLLMALDVLTGCIEKKLKIDNRESDWLSLSNSANECTTFSGDVAELKSISERELHQIILHTIAHKCLYGIDLDDAAVRLARVSLAKKCKLAVSETDFPNLRSGNSLIGLWSNPDDAAVSTALKKLSACGAAFQSNSRRTAIQKLSDKERRDLVCLQFFSPLVSSCSRRDCEQLSESMKFFHWNLEYTDIFSGENPGFDLVLTNPPWEIEKANSREFFSRYDAQFMALSKQAALVRQRQLIAQDATIEDEWNVYLAYHEGLSNFLQNAHAPFAHQGGADANSYKLFLELGYSLLKINGAMAQIVPSGIYSDKGATELRRLFLGRCRWLFLHGYHNRDGIFSIHRSFKFCTLGVVKGGSTDQISCRFLKVSPGSHENSVAYDVATIEQLSPENLAFTEFPGQPDLVMVQRLAMHCTRLGAMQSAKNACLSEGEVSISFRREFDMTNDSKLFVERSTAQKDGFALDEFGHWIKGNWRAIDQFDRKHLGDFVKSADGETAVAIDDIRRVLLPVYEGRMIGQYDWAKKAWLHGKGRRADWAELPFEVKQVLPQYLLELETYLDMQPERGAKIAYLAVGASTNSRSCIAAMIGDWPCGNAVPVLSTSSQTVWPAEVDKTADRYGHMAALLACLNSFVFDYLLRLRLSANNLNWFILKECLIPDLRVLSRNQQLMSAVCELSAHKALRAEGIYANSATSIRRLKLRAFVEALIASAYGIEDSDCKHILRGCDLGGGVASKPESSSTDKGFHRVDLQLPARLRGPYLFFQALEILKERGGNWFFEHLDSDDVLFSREEFFKGCAKSFFVSPLEVAPEVVRTCKPVVRSLGHRENGFDSAEFDAGALMTRIRNAGLRVSRYF